MSVNRGSSLARPLGDPVSKRAAGRLGAKLFVAAGALTIVNNFIPPFDHLQRGVLFATGGVAIGLGTGAWFAPWSRWPHRSSLVLAAAALVMIASANAFGGVSSYSYGVYFVVVFVYVGVTQPPTTSLLLAPFAAAAYALPAAVTDMPSIAALSATVAIPVCVLVGEVISRVTGELRGSRADSDRRAVLLETLTRASRGLNRLDTDLVLKGMVDSAVQMGFDAAEICMFDDANGVYRSVHPHGLPERYSNRVHPITSGIAGRVRRQRRTEVVSDYRGSPFVVPSLRDMPFRGVVASPVWCDGRIPAVLIAGSTGKAEIPERDVHMFELLASMAGHALENARRFEEQEQTVARLAELDRLKGDFLSNVSHELRTPLTVISGTGDTLERHWDKLDPHLGRDLLGRLNRNAQALDEIITSILDFSRFESGEIQLELRPVDLGALCTSVAGRLRSLLASHELTLDISEELVVRADRPLVERVVENLLSNAARHTPPGTLVVLWVRPKGEGVEVAVADDGPGIAGEDLPHIGDRFFRGGPPHSRPSGGTGLGIAFSREVLARHGTTLQIESDPGRGSIFSFTLPLLEQARDGLEISARNGQSSTSADSTITHPKAGSPSGPLT